MLGVSRALLSAAGTRPHSVGTSTKVVSLFVIVKSRLYELKSFITIPITVQPLIWNRPSLAHA